MKGSKPLIAITIAVTLALAPSAIAAPKTTSKAAGRVTTIVNTILNGAGLPAKTIGINGDFYIDTKNLFLYGPKVKGVRAALAWSVETAKLARDHNNANVVGIGGRMHSIEECRAIIDAFVETPFSHDERHVRRINKISKYEGSL